MKFVVDTSVIISVLMNENHRTQLIRLTEGTELVAPHSLHWEIGNALSAMFKRGRIDLDNAIFAIREYRKIPIQFYETDLEEALEIANNKNLYAYDAYFLVVAKNIQASLLSLDHTLITKAKEMGLKVIEVIS